MLLFYPGDNTPVCTKQFCSYRDRSDDMSGARRDGRRDLPPGRRLARGVHRQARADRAAARRRRTRPSPRRYGVTAPVLGTRRAAFIIDEEGIVRHRHVHTLGVDFEDADDLAAALAALPPAAARPGVTLGAARARHARRGRSARPRQVGAGARRLDRRRAAHARRRALQRPHPGPRRRPRLRRRPRRRRRAASRCGRSSTGPTCTPTPLHATAAPRTRRGRAAARAACTSSSPSRTRDLMHHKFAVRDDEAVWTGSTNWTLDDFGARGERHRAGRLARDRRRLLGRLRRSCGRRGRSTAPGEHDAPFAQVGDALVRPWFCPGRGRALSHRMADRVTTARRRVRVASPIITAGPILSALSAASRGRADVDGHRRHLPDGARPGAVERRRADAGRRRSSRRSSPACAFAGKASSEDFGRPGSVRDTMHAKVLVVDDAVFVGSFNLSRSGEANAENVLEIEDAATADRLAAWVDELRARYPPAAAALRRRRRVSTPTGSTCARSTRAASAPRTSAATIAAWIGEARRTLDLALYDVRIPGAVGDGIAAAIEAARRARRARAHRDPRPGEPARAAARRRRRRGPTCSRRPARTCG